MIYLIIVCIIAAGDQFFKHWIASNIEIGGEMELIPGLIRLTHIENTGAAFSSFSDMRWPLVAVTGVCVILIVAYMCKTKLGKAVRIPLALVLGGAVGNLIDRVFNGYVVDMFEFEFVRYAVFNIADAFINIGAILFVILYLVKSHQRDKAKALARLEREKRLDAMINDSMTAASNTGTPTADEILREMRMNRDRQDDDPQSGGADSRKDNAEK